MATFAYKIRMPSGSQSEGTLEAASESAAIDRLRDQQAIVLEIRPVQKSIFEAIAKFNPLKPGVKSKDVVIFSRQLSTLVSAGVPLVQGLNVMVDQIENPVFKIVIKDVQESIESGLSITDSMKKHPEAFSDLYVAMIKAGEVGGILDTILDRVSAYLESSEELKGKVKGALMYPMIVGVIAVMITILLLTFVIPKFRVMFMDFGADLPLPTKILVFVSDFFKNNFVYIILAGIGSVIGVLQYYKSKPGRYMIDKWSLKIPVFGLLLKKVAVSKFSRTFSTLVKSGVPILQALDTVAQTAGNRIIEEAILTAREAVKEGEKISDPLRKSGLFPPMVVQMISVGEETGNLDTMLAKIADFYDQEVDAAVKGLTSMIEPIVMVVLSLVVGFILIAMFMPMFSLGGLAAGAG